MPRADAVSTLRTLRTRAGAQPANEAAVNQFISCATLAPLLYVKGASNRAFVDVRRAPLRACRVRVSLTHAPPASECVSTQLFFDKVVPVFDQVPEKSRLALLKAVAETAAHTTVDVAKQRLAGVVQLLKARRRARTRVSGQCSWLFCWRRDCIAACATSAGSCVLSGATVPCTQSAVPAAAPEDKSMPKINFSSAEILLYMLHSYGRLASGAFKEACGVFAPTGQPSDFAEGLKEKKADFLARLTLLETAVNTYTTQAKEVRTCPPLSGRA